MNRGSRRRVAVLISGRGSNMSALIAATQAADYPADIVLVASSRSDAVGLARAAEAGVPTASLDSRDRESFERALQERLETERAELICLAGFMRLLTPRFVDRWPGRILNIHPALLPAFKGLDTHARALAAGVRIHGATVHFVSAEVDSGPIIAQAALPVLETDDAETLASRVLALEHKIYPLALKLVAEGRVQIIDGRCRIDGATPSGDSLFVPRASA